MAPVPDDNGDPTFDELGQMDPRRAERHQSLGRMVEAAGRVEFLLALSVMRLTGSPDAIAHRLIAGASVSDLVDRARQLAPLAFDEDAAGEMRTVIDKVSELMERRNAVVHSAWFPSVGTGTTSPYRWKRNKAWWVNAPDSTVDAISQLADDLEQIAFRLLTAGLDVAP